MINPLTWLSRHRFPYEPLIKVEISRSRLIHNLNEFRKLAPKGRIAPVLKSNAYGHGLLEVAGILETERKTDKSNETTIPFFVVDSYYEAVALRSRGIKTPLLIISYTRPETILASKLRKISYTIPNLESLKAIQTTSQQTFIHLKIDTGMRRQGVLPGEIDQAIVILKNNPLIILQGICSHLSDADNEDASFTEKQITLWNDIIGRFEKEFTSLEFFHLSATDGHQYSPLIRANISRLGLGLYGITDNFNPELDLQPILEMKTIVTGIKELKKGETIGYNNTFRAERDMMVATIPVGYFEGVDRRLSNVGVVEAGSQNIVCPIVGRVSMNISSIDISPLKDAKIGTVVTVIGNNPENGNSICSIANTCQTIKYDIAVRIPEHLKRVVVE